MVFLLYRPYILLPYTNPTPKLSPHRRHFAFLDFQKTSFCMIYKLVYPWGPQFRSPPWHKSPWVCVYSGLSPHRYIKTSTHHTHSLTLTHTLSLTPHTHTHTHTHSLSLSHTHSLSLSLTLTHTLSLTHTHTHTHTLSLSLTHTHSLSLSLSLSLSHTHTHKTSFYSQKLTFRMLQGGLCGFCERQNVPYRLFLGAFWWNLDYYGKYTRKQPI